MKIGVVGYGYVGSAVAHGFDKFGHEIHIYDINPEKRDQASSDGHCVHSSLEDLVNSVDVVFVCVPTPPAADGSCDTSIVRNVVKEIAKLARRPLVVAIKSTVIPGTITELEQEVSKINPNVRIVANPEFLRASSAKEDFLNPDRIVIGGNDEDAVNTVKKLYEPFGRPIVVTDPETAEMIKYASNAFLATKVSFANQIRMICERLGIDPKFVMDVVTMDHRIHPSHLDPTKGPFGGSCLPKDLSALLKKAEELGVDAPLLSAVWKVNELTKTGV